ncbi:MAG: hypothetical protein A3A86_07260 [Elusimicrobia bacterium RIFCSPLOWO2_01_FULL_60_11]|nr:MAG: hypothetical protein A3A86_07260 [Elusimicrobia bacterium RIFCSPLOWO2_01_FULL_60_11]
MESQLFELLAPLSRNPAVIFLGDVLNRLGKGDALAFIGILLVLYGFFMGISKVLRAGAVSILVVALTGPAVQVLKHLAGRARPGENLGDFHFIGPNLIANGFDSFPSGHAMSSFALASFLAFYFPRFRWLCYGAAAAISIIGRVVFRHHFLTDVIVGGILGIILGGWSAKKSRTWVEKE